MEKRTKKSIIADLECAEAEIEYITYEMVPRLKEELAKFKLTKREIEEFDMEDYIAQQQPKCSSNT